MNEQPQTIDVPGFGRMALNVDAEADSAPMLDAFLACAASLRRQVELANFNYFMKVRDRYADAGWFVPEVETPADLWPELTDPTLYVPRQKDDAWRVAISWRCSWDEEHGHEVKIKGGRVVHVGGIGDGWPS